MNLSAIAFVAILCTLAFAFGRHQGTEFALASSSAPVQAAEFRCATRTLSFTLAFDRDTYKFNRVQVCAGGRITLYGKRIATN